MVGDSQSFFFFHEAATFSAPLKREFLYFDVLIVIKTGAGGVSRPQTSFQMNK